MPQEKDFLAGDRDWLLVRAPNGQCYEFGPTQPTPAENHSVYVWTPSPELDAVSANYERHFGLLKQSEREDFHGIGFVRRLARSDPGVTIGLLHDPGAGLSPRWTDDIFQEAAAVPALSGPFRIIMPVLLLLTATVALRSRSMSKARCGPRRDP